MGNKSRGWTVGPLRGEARPRAGALSQGEAARRTGLPFLPPSKLGQGCCRSMCAGCPWAEAVRRGQLAPTPL